MAQVNEDLPLRHAGGMPCTDEYTSPVRDDLPSFCIGSAWLRRIRVPPCKQAQRSISVVREGAPRTYSLEALSESNACQP